jgi:hypothetical protein
MNHAVKECGTEGKYLELVLNTAACHVIGDPSLKTRERTRSDSSFRQPTIEQRALHL